jgi:hypothetical protein
VLEGLQTRPRTPRREVSVGRPLSSRQKTAQEESEHGDPQPEKKEKSPSGAGPDGRDDSGVKKENVGDDIRYSRASKQNLLKARKLCKYGNRQNRNRERPSGAAEHYLVILCSSGGRG